MTDRARSVPGQLIGQGVGEQDAERVRRLTSLALAVAVTLAVVLLARETAIPSGQTAGAVWLRRILLPIASLISVGVFLVGRRGVGQWGRLRQLGLTYYVLVAATIAVLVNDQPWPSDLPLQGWSPVAVWVLFYPLVVPSRPLPMGIAAGLAALMDPLAMLLVHWAADAPVPEAGLVLNRFFPSLLAIGLAVWESHMLARLEVRLDEARALGAYRLVEKLGRGGMGEVWLGKHTMLARPAAVKLIRPDALDERDLEAGRVLLKRFEREVQSTAELRSPHTVQIYDYGIGRDGTFYYAMELLDGTDLHRLVLKHGPLPASRIVYLIRQACHSLHEAHLRGLIHRDVKPANIFACRYGADLDFVKVLDFGLVKRHPGAGGTSTQLTMKGAAPGSPAFMAPEIARGETEIDGRADVYSLGCVIYWLLSGRIVFEAATPMRMLTMHAHDTPDPPSSRTRRSIPPALEAIVMDCLTKDPAERPQTAQKLSARLGELGLERQWTDAKRAQWWTAHGPKSLHDSLAERAGETQLNLPAPPL